MLSTSLERALNAGRRRPRLVAGLAASVLVVGVTAAIAGRNEPVPVVPASAPAPEPPSVTVARPERKTITRVIRQPGTVEAFERTPIHVRVPGYVEQVHVDIGDRVRRGDVLAQLAVPELEEEVGQKAATVEQAKAEIEQAQQALAAAEAGVGTAKAMIEVAEAARARTEADYARWEGEYRRVQGLAKSKVIDSQVRDETLNQFKSSEAARGETEAKVKAAEAAHQEAAARREKAKADVKAVTAKLAVAEADHRRMSAWLGYAAVRAPFDGVVTARDVDPGHFLQPAGGGGGGGKGGPLFVVERTDPVRIFVEVPEADAGAVRDGTPASVRIPALGGTELTGSVTRSSWSLEARERTLRVEIAQPNPEGKLRPGMYAYAMITIQQPNVMTLPVSAVATQRDETSCYRVENGRAVRTPIKVAQAHEGRVVVLQKQVRAARPGEAAAWEEFSGDEEIIASIPSGLNDGQAVHQASDK